MRSLLAHRVAHVSIAGQSTGKYDIPASSVDRPATVRYHANRSGLKRGCSVPFASSRTPTQELCPARSKMEFNHPKARVETRRRCIESRNVAPENAIASTQAAER